MMLRFITAAVLLIGPCSGTLHAQASPAPQHRLKVFVNPIEGSDAGVANMITAKLISHLVKHGVSVVESVDEADAVLNVSGMFQTSTTDYGHLRYRMQGAVRLVSKDGDVLWADDLSSSRYSQSASSSFSENVAKGVEQALITKASIH